MWYAKCQISEKVGKIQTTGGSVFCQGAEDGGDELASTDLLMSDYYIHFEVALRSLMEADTGFLGPVRMSRHGQLRCLK